MKKHFKYLVPFIAVFFLIPLGSSAAVAQGPVKLNWGIDVGDEVEMTIGWAIDIELPSDVWDFLTYYVQMMEPNITVGAEELYNDFSLIDSVYNLKVTILDMENYDSGYGYSYDEIMGKTEFKTPAMADYGPINNTLIYEIQQNAVLFDKYATMLGLDMTALDAIGNLSSMYPNDFDVPYYQSWYINEGDSTDFPNGLPLFIHKDWSCADLYDEMKSSFTTEDYSYLSSSLGVSITNWNELTDALGFTKISVSKREATVKFKLSSMNNLILDWYFYNMGFNFSGTIIDTYAGFLNYMNITEFDAEAQFHVEWTTAGILNNFHAQVGLTGKYKGESFSLKPQFDISRGEHDTINAKYTVPGFPLYVLIFTGVVTVSVVIVRIKKKKL
jgi:hypothetical protein